jgi:hypothetical protein
VEHKDNPKLYFPTAVVVGASDLIKICKDLGNNIPDKSWMLYLLEFFDMRNKKCLNQMLNPVQGSGLDD